MTEGPNLSADILSGLIDLGRLLLRILKWCAIAALIVIAVYVAVLAYFAVDASWKADRAGWQIGVAAALGGYGLWLLNEIRVGVSRLADQVAALVRRQKDY